MSKSRLGKLKKQARLMARDLGIGYMHALDGIARREGADSWELLKRRDELQSTFVFRSNPPPATLNAQTVINWFVRTHSLAYDFYPNGGDFLGSPDEIAQYIEEEHYYGPMALDKTTLFSIAEHLWEIGPWLRHDHFHEELDEMMADRHPDEVR